jgi:NitT/TauT family transport system substrate-binding protein
MRIAVPDLVSNSYFPIVAATELGLLNKEGVNATIELLAPLTDCVAALKDGRVDVVGLSAHAPLLVFPRWQGVKLICAQSQGTYWVLVMRKSLAIDRGQLSALRGRRIAAVPFVAVLLRHILKMSGLDPATEGIEVFMPEQARTPGVNFGVAAAQALEKGEIDGFFANGMAAEIAVEKGIGSVTLDIRRDSVPSEWFNCTMAAVVTTDAFIAQRAREVRAVKRSIIRVHEILRREPRVATVAAAKIFPPLETKLISKIVARDMLFYNHNITETAMTGVNRYCRQIGLLDDDVGFRDIVAEV